ncbi:hypothetical protein [Singulisphaera sp. PoT]|uniref:hypothetical protein n=1 Tax=Singulisphaera sp. PoT TaxID=3411797 RepID=UPI003BF5300A
MTLQLRRASWFVSALVLAALVSASSAWVKAQPQGESSRAPGHSIKTPFVSVGDHFLVNMENVAYVSDGDGKFDIYFACSSQRGGDPLRLTNASEITQAKSSLSDRSGAGAHFERHGNSFINLEQIAYIETKGDSVFIYFNSRISDDFAQLTLSGDDAKAFLKHRRGS